MSCWVALVNFSAVQVQQFLVFFNVFGLCFRTFLALLFSSLYHFSILHKSSLSRLTSDLPHSLFQVNGVKK